jgi:hypothetical protein
VWQHYSTLHRACYQLLRNCQTCMR